MSNVIRQYIEQANAFAGAGESMNARTAQTVAVLYLSASLSNPVPSIQADMRKQCKAEMTPEAWKRESVRITWAWKSVRHFGDDLATMWARGDMAVKLESAYNAIPRQGKAEKSDVEKLAQLMVKVGRDGTLAALKDARKMWKQIEENKAELIKQEQEAKATLLKLVEAA